ncbi:MAG: DinB family protein [Tepidisphaeraceae bacterium]
MIQDTIEQYAQGGANVKSAIEGLSPQELTAFPVPGKWSVQQVIVHLADCEQVYADRMKRIIAEENPTLAGFDENKWTGALYYHDQSAADAAALMDLTRRQMVRVLRKLPESAFERAGTHTQAGRKRLIDLVQGAVKHLDHHLKFVAEKRTALGKGS